MASYGLNASVFRDLIKIIRRLQLNRSLQQHLSPTSLGSVLQIRFRDLPGQALTLSPATLPEINRDIAAEPGPWIVSTNIPYSRLALAISLLDPSALRLYHALRKLSPCQTQFAGAQNYSAHTWAYFYQKPQ